MGLTKKIKFAFISALTLGKVYVKTPLFILTSKTMSVSDKKYGDTVSIVVTKVVTSP